MALLLLLSYSNLQSLDWDRMVTQCDINGQLLRMKLCSSEIAVKYVNAVRYGYTDKEEKYFNAMLMLRSAIRIFQDFEVAECVYAENGVLNRFGKKALLSKNNSLSLESKSQKVLLSEEQLNCVTETDLCALADKVTSICSTC